MNDVLDNTMIKFSKFFKVLYQNHGLAEELFNSGWFPINYVSRVEKSESESIDDFMERIIMVKYDQLKEYCLELNPRRLEIIQEAFRLYEKENYIACIPLFFTQIDGIAKDNESCGMFAGKQNQADPLKNRLLNNIHLMANANLKNALFWNVLHNERFIGYKAYENLSISKNTDKINPNENDSLNRHGVMHGNIKYKNYGNKKNAMKVICLMVYVLNLTQAKKTLSSQEQANT